jgi:hypothetical protein
LRRLHWLLGRIAGFTELSASRSSRSDADSSALSSMAGHGMGGYAAVGKVPGV